MRITLKLQSPMTLRDLNREFGTPVSLLTGQQTLVRIKHPRGINTTCYIWEEGLHHGLYCGLSEAYLVTLWENGLTIDWHGAEPLSEKNQTQVAA